MLVDPNSLAKTAENVNHAFMFGEKISAKAAREAAHWIVQQYDQAIPQRIREAARPDPRWAATPKSFNLTQADRKAKPKTFTGETVANASLRMVHSREAARALFILSNITGGSAKEAEELCVSIRDTANHLKEKNLPLFCCGPCTVSVWRLAGVGAHIADDEAFDHLLSALPKHRDGQGAWKRFPFFFTLLALSEIDHPRILDELRYAQPTCEKKLKRLKPDDDVSVRRIATVERVLEATS